MMKRIGFNYRMEEGYALTIYTIIAWLGELGRLASRLSTVISPAAFLCVSELIPENLTAYWFAQATSLFESEIRESSYWTALLSTSLISHQNQP